MVETHLCDGLFDLSAKLGTHFSRAKFKPRYLCLFFGSVGVSVAERVSVNSMKNAMVVSIKAMSIICSCSSKSRLGSTAFYSLNRSLRNLLPNWF
jgi:hypothetical protein